MSWDDPGKPVIFAHSNILMGCLYFSHLKIDLAYFIILLLES